VDDEKSLWPARIGLALAIAVAMAASLWMLPDAIRQHASELHAGVYTGIARTVATDVAVIIAVVFLLLYVTLLRGFGAGRSLTYLVAIIFVVADTNAAIVYATRTAGHERSFQFGRALADVETMVNRQNAPEDTPETLQARANNVSRTVAALSQNEAAQINRVRASYQAQVFELVLSGALKPRALSADGGIKTARAHIAQARALIEKSRDEEQKIFAQTRSTVRHTPIDETMRPQLLAAFERSLQQRSTLSKKMWDYEAAALDEADQMVRDLAKSQSDWTARGDEFLFTSHSALNTYRAHVAKLQEIQQNENAAIAETGDTVVTTVPHAQTN
jgi:hypothetical protein